MYTITETVPPAGYAKDADPTRTETVSEADLDAVVGSPLASNTDDTTSTATDPDAADVADEDEIDFHNRLGMLSWEKRDEQGILQGGATFSVTPNPFDGSPSLTGIADCTAGPCTGPDQDSDLSLIHI